MYKDPTLLIHSLLLNFLKFPYNKPNKKNGIAIERPNIPRAKTDEAVSLPLAKDNYKFNYDKLVKTLQKQH